MRPQPRALVHVLIVLAVLLAVPAAAAAGDAFQLEWGDTGKELLPGYRITVVTHGEAVALTALSGFADAVVCIGGWCFGLVGDDGVIPVGVYLHVAGENRLVDRHWQGRASYDAKWTFTLHCPGQPVDNVTPPKPTMAVLEAQTSDYGGARRLLMVDLSGGVAPDITYFYESTSAPVIGTLTSWVEVQDPEKIADCGGNYVGQPPEGGEGNRPQNDNPFGLSDWQIAVALGLVAIFLIIMMVTVVIAAIK